MYFLNRLRGTYSIFAKVNAIIIGLLFGYVTKSPYVGSAMAIGYLAGESMGWNDAEYIYGGIQDVILIGLIGVYYLY